MDGRRAAIAGQQRRVHVDQSRAGVLMHDLGNECARTPRRPRDPRSSRCNASQERRVLQPIGLQHGQSRATASALTGARRRFLTAAAGPIGLRHDADDGDAETPAAPRASGRRRPACRRTRSAAAQLITICPCASSSDFADDEVALNAAQAIDEERAVEMIHLVLKRARQQVRCLQPLTRRRRDSVP